MPTETDPSIRQLEYFLAVAEERQFTRAAERLHVAQPSVSAQIRRLELVLGTTLFHRASGPATLTDAGKELLPLARRVLGALTDVVQGMAELDGLRRGRVAVGATPSLAVAFLPAALARFHARYPEISLTVTEDASQHLVEQLEAGALDLALGIMPLRQPTLEHVLLAIEELVVVTAAGHELAGREQISIADLEGVPMIMFREGYDARAGIFAAFEGAGFAPTVAVEGGEMGSVLSMVAAGLGAAIVPSIVAANGAGLHVLRLRTPRLERQIALVKRSDHGMSRAATALFEEMTSMLAEHGWPGKVPIRLRFATGAGASPTAGGLGHRGAGAGSARGRPADP